MADFTEQERAELTRQVMEEMRAYGQLHASTADQLRDSQVGVKGFSKQVRTSTTDVAAAYRDLTKQLYANAQGLSVFNNAIETTATAVAAFGLLMGGPIVKAVSVALIGLAKAIGLANEQSDNLYNTYSRLSEVGGTAADQLSGLRQTSAQLGYVISDNVEGMTAFSNLIADNADTLALFKGTVFEGRQALANVGTQFEEYRMGLRRMGLTIDQQNKGMVAYIRLQTTLGQSQNKTFTELAAGANKYLVETQALAAITGQQRKEVEAEMQRALTEQKFRAKIDELYATGQGDLAEQYQALNVMLAKQSPEAAAGFRAMVGGSIEAAESQKLLRSSGGQVIGTLDALNKGQINAGEAFREIGLSVGATNRSFNKTAQLTSAFGETFVDYAQGQNLAIAAQRDYNKEYQKALKQTKEQRENTEDELENQAQVRDNQQKTALTMQEMIAKFVSVAGQITRGMSDLFNSIAKFGLSIINTVGSVIDYIKYDILGVTRPGQEDKKKPLTRLDMGGGQEIVFDEMGNIVSGGFTGGMRPAPGQMPAPGKPPGGATQGTALDQSRMQNYLKSMALVESSGNRFARPEKGSAAGLFQFTEDTWKSVTRQMGKNWSLQDRFDPQKSAEAAAFFTRGNAGVFEKKFGRTPSNEELYMMHFLGSGGAMDFFDALQKTPNKTAAEVVGFKAYSANRAVFEDPNTKRQLSVGEVYTQFSEKLGRGMIGATTGMYGKKPISQDVANIPQLARGGVISGPDSGYLANLHGREAVIPLPDGSSIPVAFNPQEFMRSLSDAARSSSSSGTGDLISSIQDMVRLQRDQNDLLTRMLQHQRA